MINYLGYCCWSTVNPQVFFSSPKQATQRLFLWWANFSFETQPGWSSLSESLFQFSGRFLGVSESFLILLHPESSRYRWEGKSRSTTRQAHPFLPLFFSSVALYGTGYFIWSVHTCSCFSVSIRNGVRGRGGLTLKYVSRPNEIYFLKCQHTSQTIREEECVGNVDTDAVKDKRVVTKHWFNGLIMTCVRTILSTHSSELMTSLKWSISCSFHHPDSCVVGIISFPRCCMIGPLTGSLFIS